MKIIHPVPNNLRQLEQIKIELKQTEDIATKTALSIKAAEMVLPIFEYYYPKDKRVRNSIEAAKRGKYDRGARDAVNDVKHGADYKAAAASAHFATSAHFVTSAHFAAAAYAAAAEYAIEATKEHFKLAK
jgi:hypothetical protein